LFNIDVCTVKYISVVEFVAEGNSDYVFTFNDIMKNEEITESDVVITIEAKYYIQYRWSASYTSFTELKFTIDVSSVLDGTEILTIKLNNYKKFRTSTGG